MDYYTYMDCAQAYLTSNPIPLAARILQLRAMFWTSTKLLREQVVLELRYLVSRKDLSAQILNSACQGTYHVSHTKIRVDRLKGYSIFSYFSFP